MFRNIHKIHIKEHIRNVFLYVYNIKFIMTTIIPVLELKDLYYANRYKYFPALLEVTNTVMLHPEMEIGNAYRRKQTIKEYMKNRYNIDVNGLKIMMDHGIFIDNNLFRRIFAVEKNEENILKIYNTLGITYGMSYDVSSRLHLQASVELAISKAGGDANEKIIKSINDKVRKQVELIADSLSGYIMNNKINRNKLLKMIDTEKDKFYSLLRTLSIKTVEESINNLKKQLEIKIKNDYNFHLIPVVQGLFYDDIQNAFKKIIELLISFNESVNEDGNKYYYIAIGTSGSHLSDNDSKTINLLLTFGHEYARQHNINIRFHLLGINSFGKIKANLVYSADDVTARRRAVERKLYVIERNKMKLVQVDKIKEWNCKCPACTNFKTLILTNSGERKTHVRFVHNIWMISEYIRSRT